MQRLINRFCEKKIETNFGFESALALIRNNILIKEEHPRQSSSNSNHFLSAGCWRFCGSSSASGRVRSPHISVGHGPSPSSSQRAASRPVRPPGFSVAADIKRFFRSIAACSLTRTTGFLFCIELTANCRRTYVSQVITAARMTHLSEKRQKCCNRPAAGPVLYRRPGCTVQVARSTAIIAGPRWPANPGNECTPRFTGCGRRRQLRASAKK